MLRLNLTRSEVINIYQKIESHQDIFHMNKWNTEKSEVALFLVHRELKYARIRYLVAVVLEYSKNIDIRSVDLDYMFEFDTDDPEGQLTIISPVVSARSNPDTSLQKEEYLFLCDLGTFPKSLELEAKCLYCKSVAQYGPEDIEGDGWVKCKVCGEKIYPVKDLFYPHYA